MALRTDRGRTVLCWVYRRQFQKYGWTHWRHTHTHFCLKWTRSPRSQYSDGRTTTVVGRGFVTHNMSEQNRLGRSNDGCHQTTQHSKATEQPWQYWYCVTDWYHVPTYVTSRCIETLEGHVELGIISYVHRFKIIPNSTYPCGLKEE